MAEIKIEKRQPIWPWIVGLVIVLAVVGYFIFRGDGDQVNQSRDDENNETVVIGSASEIEEYISYVKNPKMGLDHEYSSGVINRLIDATRATANAVNIDTEVNLTQAKNQAEDITKNPEMLNHADKIKSAANSIAMALKAIQTEKFPKLEAQYNKVEMAVRDIDPDVPTLEQKDAVNSFFSAAADLLIDIKNNYEKE